MASERKSSKTGDILAIYIYIYRGVADKLGHQINSDSYAYISSIASYAHDFSSMEEGYSNANDLLQTNILYTILLRLEKSSSASSDNTVNTYIIIR